jgi:hypothetical protein
MKVETYRPTAPPAKERTRASRRPGLLWPLLGLLVLLSGAGFMGGLSFDPDRTGVDLGAKLVVKAVKAPGGDFRDWDAIGDRADEIARDLDT